MAFDFDVKGMTAANVRKEILEKCNDHRLVRIMRMEADVGWVHADIGQVPNGKSRIYLFKG
jgi:hypothetical protein